MIHEQIPDDITQIDAILEAINRSILYGKDKPGVKRVAFSFNSMNRVFAVNSVMYALSSGLIYTPDPTGVEYIKDPEESAREYLSTGFYKGDCDDAVAFAGAVLSAMGIPEVKAVGAKTDGFTFWNHVVLGTPYGFFDLTGKREGAIKSFYIK